MEIEHCPQCNESIEDGMWDGWDCKSCLYTLPPKFRKAYPRVINIDDE